MQLLFFDTFSHENSDDFNLDLVQFPNPVQVTEVRVIPLGTRVTADFPGGVRLGATNPSQFHVDFFVNDLSKNGGATFHQLGSLEYKHNVEIQMTSVAKVPTDGLLLRGYYTTITLAVFGHITKVSKERPVTPPSPLPTPLAAKTKTTTHAADNVAKGDPALKTFENEKAIEVVASGDAATVVKSRSKPTSSPLPIVTSVTEKSAPPASDAPSGRSSRDNPSPHPSTREPSSVQRRDDTNKSDVRSISGSGSRESKNERREPRRERDADRERDRGRGRSRERPREPPIGDGDRELRSNRSGGSATMQQEKNSGHTPPPAPVRSRPPSPKCKRPRTPPSPHPSEVEARRQPCTPPVPLELEVPADDNSNGGGGVAAAATAAPTAAVVAAQATELFEPLTPETSPTTTAEPIETLSDDVETQETGCYPDYYEEILSEEEEMSESEADRILEFQGELDYDIGDDAYVTTFNPYHCECVPLQHFTDPSLTPFEVEAMKKASLHEDPATTTTESAHDRLKSMLRDEGRSNSPEKWVEAMEVVPAILVAAASQLNSTAADADVDALIDWCCEALDFELALQQPLAVFKVRQLKAGIKLASALFACGRPIVLKLVQRGVQLKLLNLYSKEYMALSLKLLILKALDMSTRFKDGMSALVQEEHESRTCYQLLLDMFLTKQPTRATVAITALLNKAHFFEVLQKFATATETVADLMSSVIPPPPPPPPQQQQQPSESMDTEDTDSQPMITMTMTAIPREMIVPTEKTELKEIASCLHEIVHVLRTAQQSIAQPRRSLPVKTQFHIHRNPNNAHPHVYSLLNDSHFMESLLLLLSFPQTAILPIVRDVLGEFLTSQHGMLYLLSHTAVCNAILRILLPGGGGGGGVGASGEVLSSEQVDSSSSSSSSIQLGLQTVHSLQALQCVDALLSEVRDAACLCRKEIDDPDILSNLHALYTITFTPAGRSAVVNVLASERNLEAILPFLQPTLNEELDLKLRKSACIGYATELLLMTVRQSESVSLLENFSEKLLAICGQELTSKVQELALWLAPTGKLPGYSHHALPHLCSIVMASVDDVVACPGELITALRILQHLSIPPQPTTSLKFAEDATQEELKYKYVIIQLFANDMLATFLAILAKLCDAHEYPVLHAPSLVGQRGALLVAVIKPIVAMIRHILGYLVQCRGVEFKDLTSVKTLLRVYTLLSSFPAASVQKVLMDLVDTLLTFTQPDQLDSSDSEEALSNSLWTKMVREVLAYTLTSPNVFASGLSVVSELLPLPLPIHSQEPLPLDQVNKAINYRKLWSAHLHSLAAPLQDVVTTLGGTSDQTLQHLVRRICIQLADLSAPTALMVVRGLLDAVLDGLAMIEDSTRDNFHFGHLSRLLNLLAVLMSNGCVKASLLHLVRGTSKMDLKYGELLPKLAKNLNSPPPTPVVQKSGDKAFSFQQTQECIASIFQSVCDDEITLMSAASESQQQQQLVHLEQIANSLPAKDQLSVVCIALLDHLCEANLSSPSFIISLRTLVMLTEHDYGFAQLKACLDDRSSHLHLILSSICLNFNKKNLDFMSGLSIFLELIRLLGGLEDDGPQRTLLLSPSELANVLKWTKESSSSSSLSAASASSAAVTASDKQCPVDGESTAIARDQLKEEVVLHPLEKLQQLLSEQIREDQQDQSVIESGQQTLENVNWIIQLLVSEQSQQQSEKEWTEVILPTPESLLQQFAMRMTCLVGGDVDEDALNSSFWLPQSGDDSDQECEQVSVNLKAMADEFCPGLDFAAELGNMFLAKDDAFGDKERRATMSLSKRRYQALINPGSKEPPKKKPFIAPMRGRGGYARGMIHSSRANDPFRSRPPNTSRPPSMHVDDFVAMEIFQPASSSATGQSSKRTSKESNRGRGRGNFESNSRDFGASARGRFFSGTSPSYGGRREDRGRGGARGTSSHSTTSSNVWTRDGAPPGQNPSQSSSSSSSSSKLKFGSMTPRSYVRAGHADPRSEPRVQTSRLAEASAGRFSHVDRGVGSGSGNLGLWPPGIRSKERDSRFLGTCSRGGRRDTNRHARAFTR